MTRGETRKSRVSKRVLRYRVSFVFRPGADASGKMSFENGRRGGTTMKTREYGGNPRALVPATLRERFTDVTCIHLAGRRRATRVVVTLVRRRRARVFTRTPLYVGRSSAAAGVRVSRNRCAAAVGVTARRERDDDS